MSERDVSAELEDFILVGRRGLFVCLFYFCFKQSGNLTDLQFSDD